MCHPQNFFAKNLTLIILLAIATLSRLAWLGMRPFDGDEGIVIKIASAGNFRELLAGIARDVQPPLTHIIEFLNLKIFSLTEFYSRLPFAILSIATIVLTFVLAGKIEKRRLPVLVALACIFSATLAYFAQEIRPYALLTFLFYLQLFAFDKFLSQKSVWSLVGFIFASFALLLTQYIAFIILFGELLYIIYAKKFNWRSLIAVFAIVVLFVLSWGQTFLDQIQGRFMEQSQALNLKENITGVINAFYRFSAGRVFLDLSPSISKNIEFLKSNPLLFIFFIIGFVIPFALFIWGTKILYKKNKKIFIFGLFLLVPIILAAFVSSEIGPRASRYLSFLSPIYYGVIFLPITFKPKNKLALSLTIIFAIVMISGFIRGYFERTRPGADVIAKKISQDARPQDVVIVRGGFGGGESFILDYYLDELLNMPSKIYDIYGDYKVGNLAEIKSRKPESIIRESKTADNKVYYYDLTYSFDEKKLSGLLYSKENLGKDKEDKDLILYVYVKDLN